MQTVTVQQLIDIKEIEFLKSRYCRAIDNKEWNVLPHLFCPKARFEGFGGVPADATVSDFVRIISKGLEDSITVHHLHHHEIRIAGPDNARGVWAMMDYNEWPRPGVSMPRFPDATGFCGYGFYEESYRRFHNAWRIEFMRLVRIRRDPLVRGKRDAQFNPFERVVTQLPRLDWLTPQ